MFRVYRAGWRAGMAPSRVQRIAGLPRGLSGAPLRDLKMVVTAVNPYADVFRPERRSYWRALLWDTGKIAGMTQRLTMKR